jgi:ketosteroid isomerase-like protein
MLIRIISAAVLGLAALPALAQPTVSEIAAAEANAQQAAAGISQEFASAYNAAKPADIAALFTADGVYLTPAGTMLTDHQAIAAALVRRQQSGWTQEAITVLAAHPEGSDVWAVVHYEIKGTGAQAGKQIGGYALQLLTSEGGSWRLKVLAANLKPGHDVTGMTATAQ